MKASIHRSMTMDVRMRVLKGTVRKEKRVSLTTYCVPGAPCPCGSPTPTLSTRHDHMCPVHCPTVRREPGLMSRSVCSSAHLLRCPCDTPEPLSSRKHHCLCPE